MPRRGCTDVGRRTSSPRFTTQSHHGRLHAPRRAIAIANRDSRLATRRRELFSLPCFAEPLPPGGSDTPSRRPPPIRFVYLTHPSAMMQLDPAALREAGHYCLTVTRPVETDRLLAEVRHDDDAAGAEGRDDGLSERRSGTRRGRAAARRGEECRGARQDGLLASPPSVTRRAVDLRRVVRWAPAGATSRSSSRTRPCSR